MSDHTSSGVRGASELRRGWRVVLAAGVGVAFGLSPLSLFTIGAFTKPLTAEFGWSRAEVQVVLSFITFGVLLGSPLIGILMDRVGVRRVTLLSTAGFAIGLAALGLFTTSLSTFYGIAFVAAIAGTGTTSLTWSRAIFEWFDARRGFALGLALAATGVTVAVVPSYVTWLVTNSGWRAGYIGIGLLPGLIALPLAFAFLRSPAEPTAVSPEAQADAGFTWREAIGTLRFWMIGLTFLLAGTGTGGVVTHLIPLLTDRGYTPQLAAQVAGAQGLALIAGRFVTGYLLDRIWAPALAAVVLALPAISCVVLGTGAGGVPLATVAVVLVGFASGAEFDLIAYFAARYFGLKRFGAIYGSLYAFFILASGNAPALFGWAYDTFGSYDVVLRFGAGCYVLSAAVVLTLGPYPKNFAGRENRANTRT